MPYTPDPDDTMPLRELRDRVAAQVPDEVRDLLDRLDVLAVSHKDNREVVLAIDKVRAKLDGLTIALIRAEFDAQHDRRQGHR